MTEKKGPTVTIHETPTDHILTVGRREAEVTDARGRKIKLVRPSALAQYDLALAVGVDAADNTTFMRMAMPLLYVAAIDGDPVFFPATMLQVRSLIGLLDHEGLEAVMNGVMETFGQTDEAKQRDAIKN